MSQRGGSGGTDRQSRVDSKALQHWEVRIITSMRDHHHGDEPHPTIGISKSDGEHAIGQCRIKFRSFNRVSSHGWGGITGGF